MLFLWENSCMPISIEIPERIADALERRALERHESMQSVAIEAIEKGMGLLSPPPPGRHRVTLPLLPSAHPGALRSLTNAEIDGILEN
jgi:hypothetical protein